MSKNWSCKKCGKGINIDNADYMYTKTKSPREKTDFWSKDTDYYKCPHCGKVQALYETTRD